MKFDISYCVALKKDTVDLKVKLGIKPQERFFVAGSTHPGEEEVVLAVYKKLLAIFADLKLLIAPRHPERTLQIEKLIRLRGFDALKISRLLESSFTHSNKRAVFILDTVGELLSIYSIADIVFVGGSLVKKGGHNILEPAILGKPVLFGPHMFNFRDIAELFLEQHAALLVKDEEELYLRIKDLLDNPSKIESLSQKAKELLIANQGATQNNIAIIKDLCRNISTV
jgi:3-deoxy-D-manno-octulosonic-acid transferase